MQCCTARADVCPHSLPPTTPTFPSHIVVTALSGDYSTATVVSLSADRVAPILTVGYLVTKSDWSTEGPEEGQRGELVRALCAFFQSSTITSSSTGMLNDAGLLALGSTLVSAVK